MQPTKNKNIEVLRKIAEDIDTLGLNDRESWEGICLELDNLMSALPAEDVALGDLLNLCLEGMRSIAERRVSDPLSVSEALCKGLKASEAWFLEDPDADRLVGETAQAMANLLNQEAYAQEWNTPLRNPASAKAPGGPSLDDVAALMMQTDPGETADVDRLGQALKALSANDAYPSASREQVLRALKVVEEILADNVPSPEAALEEAGRFIEEAVNVQEASLDTGLLTEQARKAAPADPAPQTDGDPVPKPGGITLHAWADALPKDADPELLTEFVSEGTDLIAQAEEALLALETNPEDVEAVGTVFRAFHTVKGSSAFLELTSISEMSHHAESLLSRVRDQEIRYAGGYADLALRALDMIKELVQSVASALAGGAMGRPESYDELLTLLADPESAGISDDLDDAAPPRIGDLLVAQGKIQREKLEEVAASNPEQPLGVALLKSKTVGLRDVTNALRTQERMKGPKQPVDSSVRVSTGRLDRLIDMVGELVIAHAMVAQDEIIACGNNHGLVKKVAHSSKIVRELQDLSMSMRMIPLKGTFQKMTRLVRDVSRKVGKNVNLVTEGDETEIDRNMVDIINDPLMHMVRNAVDHGIETPDVRAALGKPGAGTVHLSACHSAGSVVVEIHDDGKGIDPEKILAKAKEKGLVGEGQTLSEREIFNLIFEPGFSTAQTVTDVSGRGVGMDVVKKNIDALRGQVEIHSQPGRGSVFKMSLPLTLAIIDGMVVRVGKEKYVVPTVSIVRSIKPEAQNLSTVLQQGEMLAFQGRLIPLFRLADLFNIPDAQTDLRQAIVMVIEDKGRQAGLVIDDLIGRQQIVIKSLGEALKEIPGISGGAIMPNGRVGLILDVGGLVDIANANTARQEGRQPVHGA